jgi:glycosyltransferase involved in cell wall biosynthesis
MRIAFVCSEYPPGPHGGIGTFTQVLARELAAHGHSVRVAGVYPPTYPAAAYEVDRGVEVHRLFRPETRLGWVPARYELFQTIARWARAGEIDVVDMPDWEGWACGWPPLPVPVAVRLNGSATYFAAELGTRPRPGTYWIERASLARADCWSAASAYIGSRTVRLFHMAPGPITTLYNPVEEPDEPEEEPGREREPAERRSDRQVVFTGTLTPKKGVFSLVAAWPGVLAEMPEAELHLYGKDTTTREGRSMKDELRERLPAQARGSVTFHGHVERSELRAALRRARAAVFPSFAESFGIAPFEAMSTGCPTIYSVRGPGPELVRDGLDGLLIDPDEPEQITQATLRLLRDDLLCRRLGPAGRERVRDRFSIL